MSNAALLKDSIVILFLSEIDEQVLKVVIRVIPIWVHKIEQDIVNDANAINPENTPSLLNDVADIEDDRAIHITDEQSTCE